MNFVFKRVLLVAILLVPNISYAWNKAGHMVSGAIAYRVLEQRDPAALKKIVSILRQHPAVSGLWERRLGEVAGAERGLFLFMYAARWPDDIRNTTESNERWHFINLPYVVPGSGVEGEPPSDKNIYVGFEENIARFTATTSSVEDKAKALCWLFHLVGDIHQPLHVATLFSKDFKEGDRGGTRFYVRVKEESQSLSLHQLWDGFVIGTERFPSVRNVAFNLLQQHPAKTIPNLKETSYERWAKDESYPAAVRYAYQNGKLDGGIDKHDAPVLPKGYVAENKVIADKRMVAAGNRLAAMLQKLAEE